MALARGTGPAPCEPKSGSDAGIGATHAHSSTRHPTTLRAPGRPGIRTESVSHPDGKRALAPAQVEAVGVEFRRQVVLLDRFIADFVAPAAKLIVEVDGPSHHGRRAADARRDRALGRLGYRVLRLDAELVRVAPEEAVTRIRAALER